MKAKLFSIFLSFFLILGAFTSCEDFLKEEAKNFINPNDFYETQLDAEAGVTGIYSVLRLFGQHEGRAIQFVNHILSDYTYPNNFTNFEGTYNFTPDAAFPNVIWITNYDGIKRANSFIDVLENKDISFSVNIKKRYVAEAKFLRAYFYYNLVQFFGDVPLIKNTVTAGDNFFVERTDKNEVLSFIKENLQEAIPDLPHKSSYSGTDLSRANKEAAKMVLAKVYLIEKNWVEAKVLVDEIINSEEYQLEEDIKDNWREANEFGKESIFEVAFASGFNQRGNNLFNLSTPSGLKHPITGKTFGGWQGLAYTKFFYNSFEDQDLRKTDLFYDINSHKGPKGRYFTNKYFDPLAMNGPGGIDNPVNIVVFRFADVLLMKAEIENEINNGPNQAAYNAIDQVRNRANVSELDRNLNYQEFLDAVFVERAHELFCEGHRWFDLKRRGLDYLKKNVEPARNAVYEWLGIDLNLIITEKYLYLPIPLSELDANPKLTQNTGYN